MSRSYKHSRVIKGADRWFKVHGRRRVRAREQQSLRTGRYDQAPMKPQEVSDVWNWADWRLTRWQGVVRTRFMWRTYGDKTPRWPRRWFGK